MSRRKDGEAAAPERPAAPSAEDDELAKLRQELAEANDRYLRAAADFENTKKRLQREQETRARYAAEAVVRDLLPVMDSLDQALAAAGTSPQAEALIQGLRLIQGQLMAVLKQEGVERIAAVGEPFDPHRHEAVDHVPAADGAADGAICEIVRVGYAMHGAVLRSALVKVARSGSDEETAS